MFTEKMIRPYALKYVLLLAVTMLFASRTQAQVREELSPEAFMHYYVKVFNEENLAALQDIYHFPHVQVRLGKLMHFADKSTPAVDYDGLKKRGWKYSKVNHVKVLAEGPNSALTEMNFSRFNAEGMELLNQTSFYYLTRNAGYWQIISLHDLGPSVPVTGRDN